MTRRQWLGAIPAIGLAPLAAAPAENGKARFRSAICAYSFRDALQKKTMTYDDLVRMSVDLGVDGLDLTVYWFPDTSDSFLLPLRRLAYKSAVEIYSISVRTEMTRATPEQRKAEVEQIHKWVDVADKLGAGHIRVFGGNVPKGASEDSAAGWVVEVLKPAAQYAGTKGIILGLENHGGITSQADRIVDIVKRVDSPWLGINLDTGNFRTDSYNQIAKCLPHAVNVQLKAEIRGSDGAAQPSDWERLIGMFAKSAYKGYLALEYEAKEAAAVAVPRLIKNLQGILRNYA
ncbi:MAG: sugar phosphate isomerase/epimerase family protein [Bryobacteraceae bacterium]